MPKTNPQTNTAQIQAAHAQIESLLRHSGRENLRVVIEQEVVELPRRAVELVSRVLELLEENADVEVLPRDIDLTTQQAADRLNVSRPHLVDLLEAGHIPFHKVGSHRRVQFRDLLAYKRARKARSRATLEALAEEDEKLRLDY